MRTTRKVKKLAMIACADASLPWSSQYAVVERVTVRVGARVGKRSRAIVATVIAEEVAREVLRRRLIPTNENRSDL